MPTQTFYDLSEEKKQRILSAAYTEFASNPYDKVSIQSIIQTAGIPRGSFYQYFTGKDDIYIYCMSNIRQKIMSNIFQNEGFDFLWHRIYSPDTLKDPEEEWFQNTTSRAQNLLQKNESMFLDSFSSLPHSVMACSFCQDAIDIYYPYIYEALEKEGIFHDEHTCDIIAFFLSMMDLMSYEYAYAKKLPDQEAFSIIRQGFRILIDAYRMVSTPPVLSETSKSQKDFLEKVQKKLLTFSLTSIHLISASGTDVNLSFLPDFSWELQETENGEVCLFIHTDAQRSGNFVSVISEKAFQKKEFSDGLMFSLKNADHSEFLIDCTIIVNHIPYQIATSGLIGIGTKDDLSKICLIENGKFVL